MQNIQIIENYLVKQRKIICHRKMHGTKFHHFNTYKEERKMCLIFYSICGIKIHKNTTDKFKMSEKAYREILKDYY